MSRTYHHRGQRRANRLYEVWSKRCKQVSMWNFNALMKRITHRFERRVSKAIVVEQVNDLPPHRSRA